VKGLSLDSTPAPQIVLEQVATCHDGAAARAELAGALGPSSAPTQGWTVTARFSRDGAHLSIDGSVTDPKGLGVAHRVMSADGVECAGLARAVGVWASLVLDAEVDRAKHANDEVVSPVAAPTAARSTNAWADGDNADKPSPEADLFLRHARDERTIEIGLQSFLMGGTGGGAVLGPAVYGIFEAAHGIFLRPTLMVGHSVGTETTSADETFAGARLDGCARLPGFYREHRGLQLDLCAGAEAGFSQLDPGEAQPGSTSTVPFAAFGPSFGLRGELGSSFSATIRGVTEISLLREELVLASAQRVDPSVFVGRAEIGISWALR
jgi:hypothetical protein